MLWWYAVIFVRIASWNMPANNDQFDKSITEQPSFSFPNVFALKHKQHPWKYLQVLSFGFPPIVSLPLTLCYFSYTCRSAREASVAKRCEYSLNIIEWKSIQALSGCLNFATWRFFQSCFVNTFLEPLFNIILRRQNSNTLLEPE